MKKDWEFFTLEEMKCQCGQCHSTGEEMKDEFMSILIKIRRNCGFPFKINSGYRCSVHNNSIAKTGTTGPHTTGQAVDIKADGYQRYLIVEQAVKEYCTGIGIYLNHIHLDNLVRPHYPRPAIWGV